MVCPWELEPELEAVRTREEASKGGWAQVTGDSGFQLYVMAVIEGY